MQTHTDMSQGSQGCSWLKRVGWAGLIFFTVKGLLWILAFTFAAQLGLQF